MQKNKDCGQVNNIEFTDIVKLDMSTVVPTISGPKRPQDKVLLTEAKNSFEKNFKEITKRQNRKYIKSIRKQIIN